MLPLDPRYVLDPGRESPKSLVISGLQWPPVAQVANFCSGLVMICEGAHQTNGLFSAKCLLVLRVPFLGGSLKKLRFRG